MYEIQCSIEFDAAHRVLGHEGKCSHLHGHHYKVVFHIQSSDIDMIGMVYDFGRIRGRWKEAIDARFDHGVLLHHKDRELGQAIYRGDYETKIEYLTYPVTAEGIAKELYHSFCAIDPDEPRLQLTRVDVWETPNCMGSYIPS